MKVKIKKLVPEAVIPAYAKPGDAGMDLTAVKVEYDRVSKCFIYHSGLAFEVPEGHVMLLFPRSSNRKTEAYLTNSVGVIDSGYRGEVMACFKRRDNDVFPEHKDTFIIEHQAPYKVGDRFGQVMIVPYPQIEFEEADELSDTERGAGGYGSTGK
jgi:dUTP pyrophosphatase